jgi:hypothetical protein
MQTTLDTVTDYITDARSQLQDTTAPFRYDDPSLITALNVTLLETRRLRPDLFVFHEDGKVQSFTTNDYQEVEVEPQFRLAVLHGLIGYTLQRDEEDIQDVRSALYLDTFQYMLTGKRPINAQKGQPPV